MTVQQIADGLNVLVHRLANNMDTTAPPEGFTLQEWMYVKGIASAAILRQRDRILATHQLSA
jgi:hypothetical protein